MNLSRSLASKLQGSSKGSNIKIKLTVLPVELAPPKAEEWCRWLAGKNSEGFVQVVVVEPLGGVTKDHAVRLLARLHLAQVCNYIGMDQQVGGEASRLDDGGHGKGWSDDVLFCNFDPKSREFCMQRAAGPLGLIGYKFHLDKKMRLYS